MRQELPYRNFKGDDKITEEDMINYNGSSEGDLEYPKELHVANDHPLAPEVINVKANTLSEKQVETFKLINGNKEPKDEKTKS